MCQLRFGSCCERQIQNMEVVCKHQRDLNKAHDAWEGAKKAAKDKHGGVWCAGGVADGAGITPTVRELRATEKKNFRFDDTLGGE